MTDRKTLDQMTSDELDALYDERDALRAGEEPGGTPLTEPTPGQWLWQFNRVTAEQRLNVITALLRDSSRGRDCFFLGHQMRLDEGRAAWVAVARVRDVIADMEQITGARHWARILRTAIGEPTPGSAAGQVTDRDRTTNHPEVQGRCPACRGNYLFLGSGGHVTCSLIGCPNPNAADELLYSTNPIGRHPEPIDTAHRYCILCGNQVQPGHTCDPAGLRHVYGSLVQRAERKHEQAEQLAATLERARAAVHIADDEDVTDWQRGYRACANRVLLELDQPKEQPGV